jgi:hypothetical protein
MRWEKFSVIRVGYLNKVQWKKLMQLLRVTKGKNITTSTNFDGVSITFTFSEQIESLCKLNSDML